MCFVPSSYLGFFLYHATVNGKIGCCCENAWLCPSDASLFLQWPSFNLFKDALSILTSTFKTLYIANGVRQTLKLQIGGFNNLVWIWSRFIPWNFCVCVGGGPLLISQVCSVIISALVRSPYSVWSVWVTASPRGSVESDARAIVWECGFASHYLTFRSSNNQLQQPLFFPFTLCHGLLSLLGMTEKLSTLTKCVAVDEPSAYRHFFVLHSMGMYHSASELRHCRA